MAMSMQRLVETVLREEGPLDLDNRLARATARQPLTGKNPKQSIRNTLTSYDSVCFPTRDGRYGYMPALLIGATVRVPINTTRLAASLQSVKMRSGAWREWHAGG